MSLETLRISVKGQHPETARYLDQHRIEISAIDNLFLKFMTQAYETDANNKTLSKALFRTAGNRAIRIFSSTEIQPSIPVNQKIRAMHGELGVIALLAAGDKKGAIEFGNAIVQDKLIPIETQARVIGIIAPLQYPVRTRLR